MTMVSPATPRARTTTIARRWRYHLRRRVGSAELRIAALLGALATTIAR